MVDINPKKQKVAFFIPNIVGGVSSVFETMAGGFQDTCIDVELIYYRCNADKRVFIKANSSKNDSKLFITYSAFDNKNFVLKQLYSACKDCDKIVASDAPELETVNYFKLQQPVIFYVLGDFTHYYEIVEKFQYQITKFIALSDEIGQKLKSILPNRVDDISTVYVPTKESFGTKKINLDKPIKLLFAARLEPQKNPLFLAAVNQLLDEYKKNVSWTIVGSGVLELELKELFKNEKNVCFKGTLDNEILLKEYSNHDVFILPSFSEGMPVTLLDAMKVGLVPIVSNISGGIKEVVYHDVNGFLIDPNDPKSVAEVIKKLISNRQLLIKISKKALESSNLKFDSNSLISKFWEIIEMSSKSSLKREFLTIDIPIWQKLIPNSVSKLIKQFKIYIC